MVTLRGVAGAERESVLSIVIPNWNGRQHLQRNLPCVLEAVESFDGETEIIVVDDGSTDGSVDYLRVEFSQVKLLTHSTNKGFAAACWTGVSAARGEVVVLLNDDVRPEKGFLTPLVQHFRDESVFAVSCLSLGEDNETVVEAVKIPYFKRGLLKFRDKRSTCPCSVVPTFYAVGGHAAYRRDRFVELGGFDPIYSPFYWEDVDVSYRAWKRGWRVLFEPQSKVVHEKRGVIKDSFNYEHATVANHKNRFIFIWGNITYPPYFYFSHLFPTVLRVIFGILIMDVRYYRSFFGAVRALPKVMRCRRRRREEGVRSDRGIFRLLVSGRSF